MKKKKKKKKEKKKKKREQKPFLIINFLFGILINFLSEMVKLSYLRTGIVNLVHVFIQADQGLHCLLSSVT